MKKLILIALVFPFVAAKAQFKIVNIATTNIIELRSGTWPITLQKVTKENDTAYVLLFRDQQYTNDVVMTTYKFKDMEQFKYFQKGLTALKTGNNGDVVKFKDYTIKRVDIRKEGVWYVLNCNDGGITNFQQPEANKLIAAIASL